MCAKYFNDNIRVDHQKIEISDASMNNLKEVIQNFITDTITMLNIPMNDVGNLGYIIFLKKENENYIIYDIKKIEHFRTNDINELCVAIRHISGIEYNEKVQQSMTIKRNKTD